MRTQPVIAASLASCSYDAWAGQTDDELVGKKSHSNKSEESRFSALQLLINKKHRARPCCWCCSCLTRKSCSAAGQALNSPAARTGSCPGSPRSGSSATCRRRRQP